MAYKRLGEYLVPEGYITEEQLAEALEKGKKENKRLGEVLIQEGLLTEMELIKILEKQLGLRYIDLIGTDIPGELTKLVPKSLAVKYSIVPVREDENVVYLAMIDPLNFMATEAVRAISGKKVVPMIASKSAMERTITSLYGNEGVSRAINEMQKSILSDGISEIDADSIDDDSDATAPSIRLVNSIIDRAVSENASDIHLEPRENGLVVRMRIDGVLHRRLSVPKNLQNSVISRIKIMGRLNIAEKRIPQDGRTSLKIGNKDVDMRISTLPTLFGEKIVIRLLVKSDYILSRKGIGLYGENLENYLKLIENSSGVVLVVGPTGSGKSSTMYTMVQDLNSEKVNVVTLEDPVEFNLDGVNQVQINEKIGMTFATGLRSILRQDPDIISVGEIRDGETAQIAMRAAITGHLVLSTIHTNDAISTLDRLVDIGIEPYIISSALRGVISQRLARRICPHCRTSYKPSAEELAELNLDMKDNENTMFYKGKGCPECLGTGYKGRTAVFEILVLNSEIKRKFRENASEKELRDEIMKSGFKPMLYDCRKLVMEGITTVEEAKRIIHTTD